MEPVPRNRGLAIAQLLNPTTPKPKRFKAHELSRDNRIRIRAVHNFGTTYRKIVQRTEYTQQQVHRAVNGPATPQKKKPRKGAVTTPKRQQLQQQLESRNNRFTPLSHLPFRVPSPLNRYSQAALTHTIHDLSQGSFIQPKEVHHDEADLRRRISQCRKQLRLRPRPENWLQVLFSNETQAINDPIQKKRILMDKTNNLKKYALKRRKPKGQMFQGSFIGGQKGPSFIWEKQYSSIDRDNYRRHIISKVTEFQHYNGPIIFQQDNASAHRARATKDLLNALGIEVIQQLPRSPDLAPIKNIWPQLKDQMEIHYPGGNIQDLTSQELQEVIEATWEAVPEEFLLRLAYSIPRRLQMYIEAGRATINY